MTKIERDELIEAMNKAIVEPTEPMNLVEIKAFVHGFELAYVSILECIDKTYRSMKTD